MTVTNPQRSLWSKDSYARRVSKLSDAAVCLSIWLDRRAVTALEYAIIAGVLVATIVLGFNVFAGDLANRFNNVASGI